MHSIIAKADDISSELDNIERKYELCLKEFEKKDAECPETWSMKCYNFLMNAHKDLQICYKDVARSLFVKYYGLTTEEAEKKFDDYSKFIYSQYAFIYGESNFCKKNNCGVSVYLYSEYATSHELDAYVNKIIKNISARN